MATTLEDCLQTLSSINDWRGVIEIGNQFTLEEKSKFLWAWPSADCLLWLKNHLIENNIERILSIGCGSGLLEWLIEKTAGVHVIGLEWDKSWWSSAYSPKTFVQLKFTENNITNDFLKSCVNVNTDRNMNANRFALLFCYFNNRTAFLEYIQVYDGDFVILVGPMSEKYIVTDPNPMNPRFQSDEWSLLTYFQFNDQNSNCMSIFKRIKSK